MGTAFDDDALQEGLAHGLYEVSRDPRSPPGMATALLHGAGAPNPGVATVYLYKGLDDNFLDRNIHKRWSRLWKSPDPRRG
jgi:hypothetical protein